MPHVVQFRGIDVNIHGKDIPGAGEFLRDCHDAAPGNDVRVGIAYHRLSSSLQGELIPRLRDKIIGFVTDPGRRPDDPAVNDYIGIDEPFPDDR